MDEETPHLLTLREVAETLRVDRATVRRWIKLGALPAISLPRRGNREVHRIKQETLDVILRSTSAGCISPIKPKG